MAAGGPEPGVVGGGGSLFGTLGGLSTFGTILGIAGIAQQAVGAFYAIDAQRTQLRSQALDLEFQGSMAALNARQAELDAEALLEAGQSEKGRRTLAFGQVRGASRARQAASGLQAGVGSAGEVQASIEAAKEIDSLTIERNALRAANAARRRGVDLRNRSLLAGVSARNLRRTAGALNPVLGAVTSLIGGAGQTARQLQIQGRRQV